ncbi:MAG: hypothetical protein H0T78_03075 [Longispora sp.]|nr:hypothetical protein [Longispora sp. (in: high G+C Gram-positive bacteria)]
MSFESMESELSRRDTLLTDSWPDSSIDSAPLTPARRLPRRRIMLTDVQWELVVHADGRSSPMDLALRLGRSTYAMTLDARRLVAAGMLTAPEQTPVELRRQEMSTSA